MHDSLQTNNAISHYRIISKLGVGGMGEVYLAQDLRLDRKVAIKILPAEVASNRGRMARFVREAKSAAALSHPNIAQIFEIGDHDGTHFIAMEFVDGVTLRDKIHREQTELRILLRYLQHAAEGLAKAHAAGIVHRDLKPENIMITGDGHAKILDFGLAKLIEPQSQPASDFSELATMMISEHSTPGTVMGTVGYMSPEQAQGKTKEIDQRSDIFSFGCILFEAVTGKKPFAGDSVIKSLHMLVYEPTAPLAELNPAAPAELQRIVRKCLAKERDERYQTARDLMIDLKNLRREWDLPSELERSVTSHRTDAPTTQTGWDAPFDTALSAPKRAIRDAAATGKTSARQTSSAEYVVSEIKRNKTGAILLVALATIAVTASIFFLHFRSARALTEKDTILLTDFVNTTGDPVFDGTLKQALAVQLGQSPFLNIFPDDRIRGALALMKRSPDELVTRDIGREICQRQGLKAMIVGSIASLGNHYVVTLEGINVQTGNAIGSEQAEAENKEQVLQSLNEAAMKLREKLGESLQSIKKFDAPIQEATTFSLDAFKSFSLGVEQQSKGKFLEAIPFFKRATEIDPNFALAYARMASIYYNSRQYDLAAEASQKAYELRDRVSERERLYISSGYYDNVTGELEKYLETLDLWKRTYPHDASPHNNLALKYNELGQFDKALEQARESIRLNPNSASGYSLSAAAFVGLNRFDEAKQIIGQALAQKLETTAMHRTLYRIASVQGDVTTMEQQIEWAKGKPDEYVAQNWQAETAAFLGQLRKAKGFSNQAFDLAVARDLKDVAAQIVVGAAMRDALFGDCTLVKEQTAKALRISHRQFTMAQGGNAMATCGELSQAQSVIDELAKHFPKDTLLNDILLPLVRARIELNRGNPAQAIQLLDTTRRHEGYAALQVAYLRGQSYLDQKKGTDSAAEFQKIIGQISRGSLPLYPLAHLGLARAAALTGDTAKARKAYEVFFGLWRDADPDIPILKQAQREYEKLNAL